MSGSAGVYLLMTVASPFAYAGVGRFAGTDEYMMIHAVLSVSFALVRAAAWAMLLVGIVKLAADAKPETAADEKDSGATKKKVAKKAAKKTAKKAAKKTAKKAAKKTAAKSADTADDDADKSE